MKNIFLSYSKKDSKSADELAKTLKSHGFDVWTDETDIIPGENWALAIGKALDNAEAIIVLVSPDAIQSRSVQREIDFALSEPRFKNRLIPVILRPTKKIPWILEKQHLIRAFAGKRPAAFRKVASHLLATTE